MILSRRISPQKSWIFTAANNNRLRNGFSQRKIIGADRKGGRDNLTLKETIYSVLVVSSSEKFNTALPVLLSDIKYSPLHIVSSVNAAKRNLSERAYDYVIINSPLPDDVGAELAIEACDSRETVVLLLARAEYHDEIYIKVSEHGVFTLQKPITKLMFDTALGWMGSARERLRKFEKKTLSVQEKMEEIRIVNRAKCLLISELKMDEPAAHRYIEKQAMDRCVSKREIAEGIIRTYS